MLKIKIKCLSFWEANAGPTLMMTAFSSVCVCVCVCARVRVCMCVCVCVLNLEEM